jgi:hypothetical protein
LTFVCDFEIFKGLHDVELANLTVEICWVKMVLVELAVLYVPKENVLLFCGDREFWHGGLWKGPRVDFREKLLVPVASRQGR